MRKKHVPFSDELYDKIWKTKGSRFKAYNRLRMTNGLSFLTRSLLTTYLIIINLINAFNLFPSGINSNFISFLLISIAIVLLVFVILENSNEYNLKAERYHDCAKQLGRLYNRLDEHKEDISKDSIDEIKSSYETILDKYENHIPIDYEILKTEHSDVFIMSETKRWSIRAKSFILTKMKYYIFIVIPPLIILWLLKDNFTAG